MDDFICGIMQSDELSREGKVRMIEFYQGLLDGKSHCDLLTGEEMAFTLVTKPSFIGKWFVWFIKTLIRCAKMRRHTLN